MLKNYKNVGLPTGSAINFISAFSNSVEPFLVNMGKKQPDLFANRKKLE